MGSRDPAFIELNRGIRQRLLTVANGLSDFECVPLQGSGTFVVEAMVGTFVPPDGVLLVLVNGAYGERMLKMCEVIGRETRQQIGRAHV